MKKSFVLSDISDKALEADGKMTMWQGEFTIASSPQLDTFLRLPGWRKGLVWVNGFNLGRYWPVAGPQVVIILCPSDSQRQDNHFQVTLYVPGLVLRPGNNTVLLMEQVFNCLLTPIPLSSPCSGSLSLSLIQGSLQGGIRDGA